MTTIYMTNSHSIKNLPARRDFDFYPTPLSVASDALSHLPMTPTCILDPGAGAGVWGKAARMRWPKTTITGTDLRPLSRAKGYDFWFTGDYLLMDAAPAFDLVMGNPPYQYAEQFIRHSLAMLEPNGYVIMLLRLNFLEGQTRATGLWRQNPPLNVVVCSKRVSFSGDGKCNATAHAYFIWQKGWKGETRLLWSKAA